VPRLFSYVIWEDTGFAPNPFYGVCTLNCCKPGIRRVADLGDWVAGFVGSNHSADRGRLVYAMRVTQKLTMGEYDALTQRELSGKIPMVSRDDYWRQVGDSIYDYSGGAPVQRHNRYHGPGEMDNDLDGDYTLLSDDFYYFGRRPVEMPEHLWPVIHKGIGYKWKPNAQYVEPFVEWITSKYEPGKLYASPRGRTQIVERVEFGQKPPGTKRRSARKEERRA
jgi:hypothetical protein